MSEADIAADPRRESAAKPDKRIEAIDFARFVALIAMAIYHFAWDLQFFGYLPAGTVTEGGWLIFARTIASSFLMLVGVSLVLAHRGGVRWEPFGMRLLQILAGAAAITAVTYVVTPDEYVYFGILQHIAAASLLGLAFLRLPWWLTTLAAVVVLIVPQVVALPAFDPMWLNWTGLFAHPPQTSDFVPIFPFFAADLAGIAIANLALRFDAFERLKRLNPLLRQKLARPATFCGRHALLFYLLHQPILFGIVFAYAQAFPIDPEVAFARDCRQTCLQSEGEALCQRYCGCASDELHAAGLFAPLMRGSLDEAQRSDVAGITALCSRRARGLTGD